MKFSVSNSGLIVPERKIERAPASDVWRQGQNPRWDKKRVRDYCERHWHERVNPRLALAYVGGNNEVGQSGDPFTSSAYTGTAGNLLVIGVFWKGAVTISGVTGGAGTFVDCGAGKLTRPTDGFLQVFYAPNIAGGSNTVTVDFSGTPTAGETNVFKDEYSGVALSTPVDVTATGTATSTSTVTSGNLVTAQNDEVMHAFAGGNAASPGTAGTNFTLVQTNGGDNGTEYRILSATGTYTASYVFSTAISKAGIIAVAFKAAAAGGSGAGPLIRGGSLIHGSLLRGGRMVG